MHAVCGGLNTVSVLYCLQLSMGGGGGSRVCGGVMGQCIYSKPTGGHGIPWDFMDTYGWTTLAHMEEKY